MVGYGYTYPELKIYATHLFIPTEFSSGYDGPSMGIQSGKLQCILSMRLLPFSVGYR